MGPDLGPQLDPELPDERDQAARCAACWEWDIDPYEDPATYCRWLEVQRQVEERFPSATGEQRIGLLNAGLNVAFAGDGISFMPRLQRALSARWRRLQHRDRGDRPVSVRPRARRRRARPRVARGPPDDEDGDHPGQVGNVTRDTFRGASHGSMAHSTGGGR
jgi:hypothetical protein